MQAPSLRTGTAPPLVSIITIFRDANERFFAEAVGSVFAQTADCWELLLVDDGSRDGSTAFAREQARRDSERIRYLEHPAHENRGMSASRQLGVEQARGEFVAFLDADDVFLPEKLERQLALLRDHPAAAMVFGPTPHWYGWTGAAADAGHDVARRTGFPPDTLVQPPELVRAFLDRTADTPATCGVLIRRAAIVASGGFDPRFINLFEDQAFFFRLCLRFPVYVAPRHWDLYRRHPDALCERAIRAGLAADDYRPMLARGEFLCWVETEFERHGVRDTGLHRLLQAELWPYRHPWRYRLAHTGRRVRAAARGRLRRAWRTLSRGPAAPR